MTLKKVSGVRPGELREGLTWILTATQEPQAGLSLGVCRLAPDTSFRFQPDGSETAVLAFSGSGIFHCSDGQTVRFDRKEWIETPATVVHAAVGQFVEAKNTGAGWLEIFVVETPNKLSFATRIYKPQDIQIEHRGKNILENTSYRIVRLVFDDSNGPKESQLVLGEVVNLPGRWSSYPPHFHPQPEIYYYRFSPSQGYGHGELGEEVFKIENGDLLLITNNQVHAQVSAPGYHMYYLWAIRHLEGHRYRGFTFDPAHAWTSKQ